MVKFIKTVSRKKIFALIAVLAIMLVAIEIVQSDIQDAQAMPDEGNWEKIEFAQMSASEADEILENESDLTDADIPEIPDSAQLVDEEQAQIPEDDDYSVQAVLSANQNLIISAPIDGIIKKAPLENGEKFDKGDVLAQYDCRLEQAKLDELRARVRVSDRQLTASNRLKEMESISDIEYVSAVETNKQEKALLKQAQTRVDLCTITAPFDGRIKNKEVNRYEAVKSGRVLMEVGSLEPLKAELLVPSVWLRWINVGTPLRIYVEESGMYYHAEIVRIHGEVDPVTQSAHVIAKIDEYREELLPGMSGKAYFAEASRRGQGFLGLKMGGDL